MSEIEKVDIARESVITIKLGYKEGAVIPDYVMAETNASMMDLILARESLTARIHEKLENPTELLATAFEAMQLQQKGDLDDSAD